MQAGNDAAAVRAEAKTCVVLVLAEDVPGFVIQVLFTLGSAEEQGAGALIEPVLLLTAFTTLVHAVKQLMEAWQLLRHELPELERVARARDKAFAKDAVDSDEEQDFFLTQPQPSSASLPYLAHAHPTMENMYFFVGRQGAQNGTNGAHNEANEPWGPQVVNQSGI